MHLVNTIPKLIHFIFRAMLNNATPAILITIADETGRKRVMSSIVPATEHIKDMIRRMIRISTPLQFKCLSLF